MASVKVSCRQHRDLLKLQLDDYPASNLSFDILYFDPLFRRMYTLFYLQPQLLRLLFEQASQ